jgi:hypothetical protein
MAEDEDFELPATVTRSSGGETTREARTNLRDVVAENQREAAASLLWRREQHDTREREDAELADEALDRYMRNARLLAQVTDPSVPAVESADETPSKRHCLPAVHSDVAQVSDSSSLEELQAKRDHIVQAAQPRQPAEHDKHSTNNAPNNEAPAATPVKSLSELQLETEQALNRRVGVEGDSSSTEHTTESDVREILKKREADEITVHAL